MGELVTADEARRLRERWSAGGAVTMPPTRLALTIEVQAWRIAELEAALRWAIHRLEDDGPSSGVELHTLLASLRIMLGGPSDA